MIIEAISRRRITRLTSGANDGSPTIFSLGFGVLADAA
jgi:hypothetical protein